MATERATLRPVEIACDYLKVWVCGSLLAGQRTRGGPPVLRNLDGRGGRIGSRYDVVLHHRSRRIVRAFAEPPHVCHEGRLLFRAARRNRIAVVGFFASAVD